MSPNEIKKNLRYCIDSNDCIRCDFTPSKSKKRTVGCQYELTEKALAYINQLEAEVERLKAEQEMADGYAEAFEERIKSEAYKEILETLKERAIKIGSVAMEVEIDNLVKEMESK